VCLAGHSLGCLMGGAFATAHPRRVARLLLSSPALGHGMARGQLSPAAQSRIDDLERLGPQAFAETRAAGLVFEPERHAAVTAFVRDAMAKVELPGYRQASRMLASGGLLDDLARLEVPTDVIVGEQDRITPPDAARQAHAALRPQWRGALTFVPGCGHALYQQAPAAFASALAVLAETAG